MASPDYSAWIKGQIKKQQQQAAAQEAAKRRAARKKGVLSLAGTKLDYPEYSVETDMSIDAENFSNPLTTAKADTFYYVRSTITQHVGEPMWQGFRLEWAKPRTWAWADGVGIYSYEEAISNPIVIIRKVRSPRKLEKVTFRTTVVEKFR